MRYIKPQTFSHEDLFDLEEESHQPVRLAWVGLILYADREGRFPWKPRSLKKDILPFDEKVNFETILNSFESKGMVHYYEHRGERYGHIPSWNKHQKPNPKEPLSSLPDHRKFCPCATGTALVGHPLVNRGAPSVCVSVSVCESETSQRDSEEQSNQPTIECQHCHTLAKDEGYNQAHLLCPNPDCGRPMDGSLIREAL